MSLDGLYQSIILWVFDSERLKLIFQYSLVIGVIWLFRKPLAQILAQLLQSTIGSIFALPKDIIDTYNEKPLEFLVVQNNVDNQSQAILNHFNNVLLKNENFKLQIELKLLDNRFQKLIFDSNFLKLNDEKIYKFEKELPKKWFSDSEIEIYIKKIDK